jgi:hypothetical protein
MEGVLCSAASLSLAKRKVRPCVCVSRWNKQGGGEVMGGVLCSCEGRGVQRMHETAPLTCGEQAKNKETKTKNR